MKVVTIKPGDYIVTETIDDQISIHTSILVDLIIRLYLKCRVLKPDRNRCLNNVVRTIESYLDDIVNKTVEAIKLVDNYNDRIEKSKVNDVFDEILKKLFDLGLFIE